MKVDIVREVDVVRKASFKVVGVQVIARWNQLWELMPDAWNDFVTRYADIKNRVSHAFMDLTLGRHGDEFTQLICCEVTSFDDIPPGMVAVEIPDQDYIHLRHDGPIARINAAFGEMHDWAYARDYTLDDFRFDAGYSPDGQDNEHDLYVRLVT